MASQTVALPFVPSLPSLGLGGSSLGLPSVSDIINTVVNYISKQFLGGNPLQSTINVLLGTPDPSFSADWYTLLYRELLGTMIVVLIGGVLWRLAALAFGGDLVTFFASLRNCGQYIILGPFVPPLVTVAVYVNNTLAHILATAGSVGAGSQSKWKGALAIGDLQGNLFVKGAAYAMGGVLRFEVTPLKQLALLYTLLLVVTGGFAAFSGTGGWLFRWVLGGMISIITSLPFMVLILAVGGNFMSHLTLTSADRLIWLVSIGYITMSIPFVIFIAAIKQIKVRQKIAKDDERIRVASAHYASRGYDEEHIKRQFSNSLVAADIRSHAERGSASRTVVGAAVDHGGKLAAGSAAAVNPAFGAAVRGAHLYVKSRFL